MSVSPRDAAGQVELQGGTGEILHMVSVTGGLELFKTDVTFRVQVPQDIDPQNLNPAAPWVVTRVDHIGASSPAVARSLLQGHEMLRSGVFNGAFDRVAVVDQLHTCKDLLVICEQTASRLRGRIEEVAARVQAGLPRDNAGRAINAVPQVPDLVADTTAYLSHAKRVLAESVRLLSLMTGWDVRGPDFRRLGNRLEELAGATDSLTEYVRREEPTVRWLVDLRNGQEHPDQRRTIVRDFHVLPSGEVSAPVLHLSDAAPQDLAGVVTESAAYLVRVVEAMFLQGLLRRRPAFPPMRLVALDDDQLDPACPIKYRLEIDAAAIRGNRP